MFRCLSPTVAKKFFQAYYGYNYLNDIQLNSGISIPEVTSKTIQLQRLSSYLIVRIYSTVGMKYSFLWKVKYHSISTSSMFHYYLKWIFISLE